MALRYGEVGAALLKSRNTGFDKQAQLPRGTVLIGTGQAQHCRLAVESRPEGTSPKQHRLDIQIPGGSGSVTVYKCQPIPEVDATIAWCP